MLLMVRNLLVLGLNVTGFRCNRFDLIINMLDLKTKGEGAGGDLSHAFMVERTRAEEKIFKGKRTLQVTFSTPRTQTLRMSKTLMSPDQAHELQENNDDFFNKINRRSIWNLIPESMRELIENIPKEYFGLSEHEARKKLKPNRTIERLRIAFWFEYDRAQGNMDNMRMSSVYGACVSKQYWCTNVLENQRVLAYILTPPADYIIAMKEILMQGVEVMRDIVTAKDIVSIGGKLNAKNAEVALKAIEMAHIRVHGAPVIRTKTESVNVNLNQIQNIPAPTKSVKDLEQELAMLKDSQVKALEQSIQQGVIDVTPAKEGVPVEQKGG